MLLLIAVVLWFEPKIRRQMCCCPLLYGLLRPAVRTHKSSLCARTNPGLRAHKIVLRAHRNAAPFCLVVPFLCSRTRESCACAHEACCAAFACAMTVYSGTMTSIACAVTVYMAIIVASAVVRACCWALCVAVGQQELLLRARAMPRPRGCLHWCRYRAALAGQQLCLNW